MTGILIVTHERLGDALIDAAEFILEDRPGSMESVSINLNENPDKLRSKIKAGIKLVKDPDGVLIMTDMFGGTPSNLSYSFLSSNLVKEIFMLGGCLKDLVPRGVEKKLKEKFETERPSLNL